MKAIAALRVLLALLKAQVIVFQDAHWEVRGPSFYGNHQMFQRLYEGVQEHLDVLAEKMVALFGPSAVSPKKITSLSLRWVDRWVSDTREVPDVLHERALKAESDFAEIVTFVYDLLQAENTLSLGMDDFLMSMANDHETYQYLLLQSMRA